MGANESGKRGSGRSIAFIAVVIVVGVCIAAIGIYSGVYDVAASTPHLGVTEEVLNFTMERSVAARADDIKAPDLSSDDLLSEGIPHFDEMCADCHGAPGKEPNYIGKGLNPPAPDLASEAAEWSDAELFWITKHGVKMTGMPAFGQTHDDEELWPIVAAIRELPELSPDEYADRVDGHHDGGEADGHEGDHEH